MIIFSNAATWSIYRLSGPASVRDTILEGNVLADKTAMSKIKILISR